MLQVFSQRAVHRWQLLLRVTQTEAVTSDAVTYGYIRRCSLYSYTHLHYHICNDDAILTDLQTNNPRKYVKLECGLHFTLLLARIVLSANQAPITHYFAGYQF